MIAISYQRLAVFSSRSCNLLQSSKLSLLRNWSRTDAIVEQGDIHSTAPPQRPRCQALLAPVEPTLGDVCCGTRLLQRVDLSSSCRERQLTFAWDSHNNWNCKTGDSLTMCLWLLSLLLFILISPIYIANGNSNNTNSKVDANANIWRLILVFWAFE